MAYNYRPFHTFVCIFVTSHGAMNGTTELPKY